MPCVNYHPLVNSFLKSETICILFACVLQQSWHSLKKQVLFFIYYDERTYQCVVSLVKKSMFYFSVRKHSSDERIHQFVITFVSWLTQASTQVCVFGCICNPLLSRGINFHEADVSNMFTSKSRFYEYFFQFIHEYFYYVTNYSTLVFIFSLPPPSFDRHEENIPLSLLFFQTTTTNEMSPLNHTPLCRDFVKVISTLNIASRYFWSSCYSKNKILCMNLPVCDKMVDHKGENEFWWRPQMKWFIRGE